MASVFRQPRSPFWQARFKDESGKWRKQSTNIRCVPPPGRGTPRKAKEDALKMAQDFEEKHIGSPVLRAYLKNARSRAERISPGSTRRASIRDFFQAFIAQKEKAVELGHNSSSTLESYSGHTEHFLEWMGNRANAPITDLLPQTFEEYRDHLLDEGKGVGTVGKYLKSLTIPLNDAFKSGRLEINPLKTVKLPKGELNEREPFNPQEVRDIAKVVNGEWQTTFLLGLYTGARLGDCVRMRWEQVDIFKGTVTFTQEKTKRHKGGKITIPLHENLWTHLRGIHEKEGYIVPGHAARLSGGKVTGLSTEFAKVMRDAGVGRKQQAGKAGRKFSAKSFHSLRHTLTSAMSAKGVSEEIRSRITGHKLKGMNQHYTHTEIEDARKGLSLVSF